MHNHREQGRQSHYQSYYQGNDEGAYRYASTSTSSRPYEDPRDFRREPHASHQYPSEKEARYRYSRDYPARDEYYGSNYPSSTYFDGDEHVVRSGERYTGERYSDTADPQQEDRRGYQEDRTYNHQEYSNRPSDGYREEDTYHEQQYADERQDQPRRRSAPPTQLRLVKITSDVIPECQYVAVIDARSEITSIGRDRIFTPRIRCPSMEVSKNHANIFRMNGDQRGRSSDAVFAVTDTGSTHGTHLLLDPPPDLNKDNLPSVKVYQRLSPPKKASLPKTLRHLCLLKVGQTVFQAHLHSGTVTCSECTINEDGSNEIPLLEKKEKASVKPVMNESVPTSAPVKLAHSEALKALKNRHLGDDAEEIAPSLDASSQYVDRAAARRARGGVQDQKKLGKASQANALPPKAPTTIPPVVTSEAAAKLDANNRGFKMFEAMTSKSLDGSMGKYDDPVMARGVEGTAGLGSKRLLDVQEMASRPSGYSAESIRERQRRRFEESR